MSYGRKIKILPSFTYEKCVKCCSIASFRAQIIPHQIPLHKFGDFMTLAESFASFVSCSWSEVLFGAAPADRRALLYSVRAAVKLRQAGRYRSSLIKNKRNHRCKSTRSANSANFGRRRGSGPKRKSKTGYATIGELSQRYQSHAEDQATMAWNSSAPRQSLGARGWGTAVAAIGFCDVRGAKHAQRASHSFCG